MLWSLLKIVIFIALVAALALGVDLLTGVEDVALLTVAGREFVLSPIVAIIGALLLLLAVWVLFRLVGLLVATIRFFAGDETAISRYFARRSERKGYEALSEGMMALAAGEGRLAIRKAERAEKLLGRPELTKLVVAQGAEMVGDRKLAIETYKALVTDDRTRFVGVRGLMKQKLDAGDSDTALKLAERALALRPKNEEVQTTLLQLQSRAEDWSGARQTLALALALKSGTMPRDLHTRRDAVLALANARDAMAEGKVDEATRQATQANKLAPALVPAAVMAARLAVAAKQPRVATRILRAAWDQAPHPDLAAAFAEIAPDETPAERLARFRPLISKHAKHPEAKMIEAELHIAAEDFPAARRALGDLAERHPTARSLTIMAAIERGEGSPDRVVRAWLAKAVTASRGPQWTCDKCGHVHADWRPVCSNCESFDTLSWEEAPQSDAALAGPQQMLPLIVGALEDQRSETTDDADVEVEILPAEQTQTPGTTADETAEASGAADTDANAVSDAETAETVETTAR